MSRDDFIEALCDYGAQTAGDGAKAYRDQLLDSPDVGPSEETREALSRVIDLWDARERELAHWEAGAA